MISTNIHFRNAENPAITAQVFDVASGDYFLSLDLRERGEDFRSLGTTSLYLSLEQAEMVMERLRVALEDHARTQEELAVGAG